MSNSFQIYESNQTFKSKSFRNSLSCDFPTLFIMKHKLIKLCYQDEQVIRGAGRSQESPDQVQRVLQVRGQCLLK